MYTYTSHRVQPILGPEEGNMRKIEMVVYGAVASFIGALAFGIATTPSNDVAGLEVVEVYRGVTTTRSIDFTDRSKPVDSAKRLVNLQNDLANHSVRPLPRVVQATLVTELGRRHDLHYF